MRRAFSDENRTTFALLAVLALTVVAFVVLPTRRVVSQAPATAHGRIESPAPHGSPRDVRGAGR